MSGECGEKDLERQAYIKEPNCDLQDYQKFHCCEIPCQYHLYEDPIIDECFEDQEGYLFISNGQYRSQVNYCPMCGYRSKKKIS